MESQEEGRTANDWCISVGVSWSEEKAEEEVMAWSARVALKGLQLSVVDAAPREILLVTVDQIVGECGVFETGRRCFRGRVHALQVDNQLAATAMPVLLRCADAQTDSLQAVVVTRAHPSVLFVEYADVLCQEVKVSVDSAAVAAVTGFVRALPLQLFDAPDARSLALLRRHALFRRPVTLPSTKGASVVFLQAVSVSPVLISVTTHINARMALGGSLGGSLLPGVAAFTPVEALLDSLGGFLGTVDNAQLTLDRFAARNLLLEPPGAGPRTLGALREAGAAAAVPRGGLHLGAGQPRGPAAERRVGHARLLPGALPRAGQRRRGLRDGRRARRAVAAAERVVRDAELGGPHRELHRRRAVLDDAERRLRRQPLRRPQRARVRREGGRAGALPRHGGRRDEERAGGRAGRHGPRAGGTSGEARHGSAGRHFVRDRLAEGRGAARGHGAARAAGAVRVPRRRADALLRVPGARPGVLPAVQRPVVLRPARRLSGARGGLSRGRAVADTAARGAAAPRGHAGVGCGVRGRGVGHDGIQRAGDQVLRGAAHGGVALLRHRHLGAAAAGGLQGGRALRRLPADSQHRRALWRA
ncbi:vacuolar protein sorting-associated protein 13 [Blastocystis sp. ATCC 50177/Nand II]|uniref:Vacuolar protein sorting-associated protein 13 n=1 Tax=Blastocystis sp. subtype 1 (strain ATCC 50177 / NandII) TaxID=478820 RepID=A0A196S9K9_BLAHN|nr:vacuolar protein sorting-associated protein 13 [Blastocystis sp. ATCC 50177/Nand II]